MASKAIGSRKYPQAEEPGNPHLWLSETLSLIEQGASSGAGRDADQRNPAMQIGGGALLQSHSASISLAIAASSLTTAPIASSPRDAAEPRTHE